MTSITDFQRSAFAAFGALLLTATTLLAAVGPARAVETQPVQIAMAADEARG